MTKNFLIALFSASLAFAGCSKDDGDPVVPTVTNQFIINGVRDVNLGSPGGNILPISIQQSTGVQEVVTISVSDLPAGIAATVEPAAGTPTFSSTITFSRTGAGAAGTYPIKIKGTSASYTKSYDLNLIVPTFNGFIFDGKVYNKTTFSRSSSGSGSAELTVTSIDNGGATLRVFAGSSGVTWPSANGSYSAVTGGMSGLAIGVTVGTTAYVNGPTLDTATYSMTDGKLAFVSDLSVLNGSGTKSLYISVQE